MISSAASVRSQITVLVVDDHEMLLESLVRNLDRQSDITVVASAVNVSGALTAVATHQPDVVVMDYNLPDGDGASAARQITQRWPSVRVIMLTGSSKEAAVFEAAWGGCSGYLEKTSASTELVDMVRRVRNGANELPLSRLDRLPQLKDLVVHYQPVVNLTSTEIVGFEALVRWNHPTRGLLEPAEFIGLAEQTSFIVDIDEYVRHEACRQAADWNRRFARDPARFMSVNVSGRELRLPDLAARILRTLDGVALDPKALMVEVTETFLVGDAKQSSHTLKELSEAGVLIALDDFGTAYSSLEYLRRFPVDVIKLDKSFTCDLPSGERGLRLAHAVGQLATGMGAVGEAEGIETEEQATCLRSLGWQLGQGYYFSRPVDSYLIESLLQR